jgi:Ala-tRNA(Pro) deacylase
MDVLVDDRLMEDSEIALNAGRHNELIRMKWDDYERVVQPQHTHFSMNGRSRRKRRQPRSGG